MTRISFRAPEYNADQSFRDASFAFEGSEESGWRVERDGAPHLELGPGYRLLRTEMCGVCSTDLARHFLPFPLPQVTGHELVARDARGLGDERYVVEINASHHARALDGERACAFCAAGLDHHCPERLVLGIHDLPGGFGAWILAPTRAVLPVPRELPTETAVLVEPFAAALNAVDIVRPRAGDRIAVLGPRRLGMLVVAALAAHRRASGIAFDIVALSRRVELLELARSLGATDGWLVEGDGGALPDRIADVVIDTTGNPDALELATRLASREVHLKSTHGQRSVGLGQLTALVVDELVIERGIIERSEERLVILARALHAALRKPHTTNIDDVLSEVEKQRSSGSGEAIWISEDARGMRAPYLVAANAAAALAELESSTGPDALPRADVVLVATAADIDAAIRPRAGNEASLVRPRGTIRVQPNATRGDSVLVDAIADRGLRLSSSRCGDFARALALLAGDARLRDLGERFVTHRFTASDASAIDAAFRVARSPACIKAIVRHPR